MIQQILYFFGSLVCLPLLPVLFVMGQNVRRKVPALPEASDNIVGNIVGKNKAISLLVLGESSMAGVGVTNHKEAITGQIAQTINYLNNNTVSWQVLARNGYTAQKVNQELVPKIPKQPIDIIIIGLGGNDTFRLNSPLTFKKNMVLTIENIQKCQPDAKIVIVNMPPIAYFPAFPSLMRYVLSNLVQLHGAVIGDLPHRFKNLYYIAEPIRFEGRIEGNLNLFDYFSDGVHPSALTYRIWGQDIGEFILKNIL
jgi:lysophospholipase L1-like esterase